MPPEVEAGGKAAPLQVLFSGACATPGQLLDVLVYDFESSVSRFGVFDEHF
jgi:hypothetical protein